MWTLRIRLLSLASAALLASACAHDAGDAPTAAVASTSTRPAHRVAATGRIEGWREADVISKLPGRILRIEYEEGDVIELEAPVVHLEDHDLEAKMHEAAAHATNAQQALARLRRLRADAIVSASDLDRAEADARSADAALDLARVTLEYATIRAPFRGTMVRKFKEVGEGVLVSGIPEPLFRIADLSRLKVRAEVPEIDIAGVRVGQTAEVTLEAYPGERFSGTVMRVGLAVGRKQLRSDDPRERRDEKVVEVELELPGDARLKSGMTVDVAFRDEQVSGAK
jgi:RND family efflux transporter MFP subunit